MSTNPTPIILLHGWAMSPAVWKPVCAALGPGFDVYTPTLPGHAENAPPSGEDLAVWARALLPSLPGNAIVVGWSLGALLAVELALNHPECVQKLVLIAGTPRFVAGINWPFGLDPGTVTGFIEDYCREPETILRRFIALQTLGEASRRPLQRALEATSAPVASTTPAALESGLKILARSDLRRGLTSLRIPVHLIHGDGDALMPVAAARWMADLLPAARLTVLGNSGHALPLSRPAECAEIIRAEALAAQGANNDPRRAFKNIVRRAFDRASPTYDKAANIQHEAALRLLKFAGIHPPEGRVQHILDAGCGTGFALPMLMERFPDAHCQAADFSLSMLKTCTDNVQHPARLEQICADIERLPLRDEIIDLYWSSLVLQWCDPVTALSEAARVLRPGGTAWIATLGPLTLFELREAFGQFDDGRHVIDFHASEDWVASAREADLLIDATETAPLLELASDLRTLVGIIKAVGAHTVNRNKPRFLGQRGWDKLQTAYEAYRRPDGTLPATYDLIMLALRKPA